MKNREIIRLFSLLVFTLALHYPIAQNLIPNGDFESGDLPCQNPDIPDGEMLDNWYAATGSSLRYNRLECERTLNGSPYLPHSGNGSLVISGSAQVNGLLSSSFLVNDFEQPLRAGLTYFLVFYGKSKGIYHVEEEELRDCDINPPKDINFYLGKPEMEFGIERTFGEHLVTDIQLLGDYEAIPFRGGIRILSAETGWQRYSTCFEAEGGESKLAISGPIRFFSEIPPCEFVSDEKLDTLTLEAFTTNRFFQFFNYEIDDVALFELPDELEASDTICQFQYNTVNLLELVPDSPIYEDARFLWEDGSDETVREFANGGFYQVQVMLPCKTIPLRLTVHGVDCPAPVYLPNVFSPNQDGLNDTFKPSFSNVFEIQHYRLTVYDRWGNQVFASRDPSEGWTGDNNGRRAADALFLWFLEYQFAGFSRVEKITGDVMVLR